MHVFWSAGGEVFDDVRSSSLRVTPGEHTSTMRVDGPVDRLRIDPGTGGHAFTPHEITPGGEFGVSPIGKREAGPVTRALQQRFFGLVRGQATAPEHWRTSFGAPGPMKKAVR